MATGYCGVYAQLFRTLCIIRNEIPDSLDLATGLAKTASIPIWLSALTVQAGAGHVTLPRRLVYIVNRRTVVDQATSVVEEIGKRIINPEAPSWRVHAQILRRMKTILTNLSSGFDDMPLAISTLRGQMADNEEWKTDPARPAIIIGTIDMIGSKLLFNGYGDGRYHRPHHAGMIGQDSLIVHDEAHLTPAFSQLLRSIVEAQRQSGEMRPLHVLELSATSLRHNSNAFKLSDDDSHDEYVQQRLNADKSLRIHEVEKDDYVSAVVELATAHEQTASKILIYDRSPDMVEKITKALKKKLGNPSTTRIALLTGTMRGFERDRLVRENSVYRCLLDHQYRPPETVYLVSTSAGEVGIDLDADNLVCDRTTLDSMIQRLGRVNRCGRRGRGAIVDVVVQKADQKDEKNLEENRPFNLAIVATLKVLGKLPKKPDGSRDASPLSILRLLDDLDESEKAAAFSPEPPILPLTDIMLDTWSLTSIMHSMPGRLEVVPFLHGLVVDQPETYVAWRTEVALFGKAGTDTETLEGWFRVCRIEPRELLREHTNRLKKALQGLLKNHRKAGKHHDFSVILLSERGDVELRLLSEIVDKDFRLAYRTVILPVEAGGLQDGYGLLDPEEYDCRYIHLDAAEADSKDGAGRCERWLFTQVQDTTEWVRLTTGQRSPSAPEGLREIAAVSLQDIIEGREDDAETRQLILFAGKENMLPQGTETLKVKQILRSHTNNIESCIRNIAEALNLDSWLINALISAAQQHDKGKNRPIWQQYACNPDVSNPLAKSMRYHNGRNLCGYRHEFGSLLEAVRDVSLDGHPERDLILHLIAAHHGWGRPHFDSKAGDSTRTTEENEREMAEVMRRFGLLQQRFGRWGLAWLEAILRCADIAASKPTTEMPVPEKEE